MYAMNNEYDAGIGIFTIDEFQRDKNKKKKK